MLQKLTMAVWVVILVPPEAPMTRRTLPVFLSTMMVGTVDESGILPALIIIISSSYSEWLFKLCNGIRSFQM